MHGPLPACNVRPATLTCVLDAAAHDRGAVRHQQTQEEVGSLLLDKASFLLSTAAAEGTPHLWRRKATQGGGQVQESVREAGVQAGLPPHAACNILEQPWRMPSPQHRCRHEWASLPH